MTSRRCPACVCRRGLGQVLLVCTSSERRVSEMPLVRTSYKACGVGKAEKRGLQQGRRGEPRWLA